MASYNAVVAATAKVVHEANLAVIDDLLKFLDSRVEIDEDFKELIAEFKGTLKAPTKSGRVPKGEKKKREPSAYNLWIRDALKQLKEDQPELKGTDRMKEAMKLWKEHKDSMPSSPKSTTSHFDEVTKKRSNKA